MSADNLFLTIIMPALNEEKNILSAIDDTISAFKELNIKGEIIVVNDGSTDSTAFAAGKKIEEHPNVVRMITHSAPKGIGASFWDGVDNARGEAVCMLPGDNENEPREILRYLCLLENVDIVIPFVFNKTSRSLSRNIISFLYRFIINSIFFISLNYTNGTVICRKSLLKSLNYRAGGFFYQTDILVRLIKQGYLFAEVPYRLRGRHSGKSKALRLGSFIKVVKGCLRLFADIYCKKEKKEKKFTSDSLSLKRYQ